MDDITTKIILYGLFFAIVAAHAFVIIGAIVSLIILFFRPDPSPPDEIIGKTNVMRQGSQGIGPFPPH